MQLDQMQVVLRPRSPWEAMELGVALVRRHARPLWKAWFIASLPLLVVLNVVGWMTDQLIWAAVAMWWLKPLFDRLPLFLLSRAVFGAMPPLGAVLRAPITFGWRSLLRDLTWARLSPFRSVAMPVRLLEGGSGEQLTLRRRAIIGSGGGAAAGLTLLCLHFEIILGLAFVFVALLFVPVEFLSESFKAMWSLLFEQPPKWAQVLMNAVAWSAISFMEPFYVGAGFAFYLNRRTQLEAWDLELAFRRLAMRLRALAPAMAIIAMLALPLASHAQARNERRDPPPRPLQAAMQPADAALPDPRFQRAVKEAYNDPLLRPRQSVVRWEKIESPKQRSPGIPWLGRGLGGFTKAVLWLLLAVSVVWLVATSPRWWPTLWGKVAPLPGAEHEVDETAVVLTEPLPEDIATAARALWQAGKPRAALAMLYRGSVAWMMPNAGVSLPPGATEAHCLRAARGLPEAEDRDAFAEVVRTWQHAAYASRVPSAEQFDALLQRASRRFGWGAM